ncbi:glycine cleavage T C-terminal barrel domain-containing protein [Devosia sp.]|uniref:glycine cleavage T C-terminal barrel domain-containing protein n=1 Tax=Devosia sp. TaxID=1871048 RepID=UPI0035AE6C34
MWRVDGRAKAFVDFQNDVTAADIDLAVREGYASIEHVKRYTTLGMAPDQGRTSNINALGIVSELVGKTLPEVGTTGFRFPFVPVPLSLFRGRQREALFRPVRRLAAQDGHVAAGAVFEEYGDWLRPSYYPRPGEDRAAAERREALAVRHAAGLFDASPLGKIEVRGPDAATFLDRIYANTVSTLKIGRLRYGIMLNEFGIVIDDGVVARLAEDCFLVGTTSSGAGRIAVWLEEWLQCEWTDLDVIVAPVTTSRSVMTITGPAARAVLGAVGVDFDIGAEALPHVSFRDGRVAGLPARVSRVSFTGEVSYEVAVPWSQAEPLRQRLMDAGGKFGLTPVGVDAWMLLRTEKGFLHVGVDTDGTTTALDIGWGHVLKRGDDFVGRRSLVRPADQAGDRFQFVGLADAGGEGVLPIGAHLCRPGISAATEGFVTSSGFSPVLGHGVALGLVKGGRDRIGEVLELKGGRGGGRVRVVRPGAPQLPTKPA